MDPNGYGYHHYAASQNVAAGMAAAAAAAAGLMPPVVSCPSPYDSPSVVDKQSAVATSSGGVLHVTEMLDQIISISTQSLDDAQQRYVC